MAFGGDETERLVKGLRPEELEKQGIGETREKKKGKGP